MYQCRPDSALVAGFIVSALLIACSDCATKPSGNDLVERIDDLKDFKKLLRTKTNVLVLFSNGEANKGVAKDLLAASRVAAERVYGKGSIVFVDCSSEEGRKLCKKMKATPKPLLLNHYLNGEFNKQYDRAPTADSIVRFLLDPTGDLPWEEEPTAQDVLHISDSNQFQKLLKRSKLPLLIMFYAPWCGHCKRIKPDYGQAATTVKAENVLVAVDATRPDNHDIVRQYNVTGFPTILYFEEGKLKYPFNGERTKEGIISWLKDPQAPSEASSTETEEKSWSDEQTDVIHLKDDNFHKFMEENPKGVLVMFYAPWCGHCKRLKPEYIAAAKQLKEQGNVGVLAAVDATVEKALAREFDVKGFPTLKYFQPNYLWDVSERTKDKLVAFMKDPQEPPAPPAPEPSWEDTPTDVRHLSDSSFRTELKKIKHALVMYHAPWCGHCKATKPDYIAAASLFKDNPKVAFFAFDCSKYQEFCQQQYVQGLPTIFYYSYLKTELPYAGDRSKQSLVDFLLKQGVEKPGAASPPSIKPPPAADTDLKSLNPASFKAALDKTSADDAAALFIMFHGHCEHCQIAKPEFIAAAAEAKSKASFATVNCDVEKELCRKENVVDNYPIFKLFRKGKCQKDFNGQQTKSGFLEFLSPQRKTEL